MVIRRPIRPWPQPPPLIPLVLTVPTSELLSGLAAVLLVFVSGGVIYLSSVEWRDRRRRTREDKSGRGQRRK